jgi:hypothetical protein
LAGPYRPPSAPQSLGRVTLDFASAERAAIAFTGAAAEKAGGLLQSILTWISPQLSTGTFDPATQWPTWRGGATFTAHVNSTSDSGTYVGTETWTITDAVFTKSYVAGDLYEGDPNDPLWVPHQSQYYTLSTARLSYSFYATDSHNGCIWSGRFPPDAGSFPINAGQLMVRDDYRYTLELGSEVGGYFQVDIDHPCDDGAGNVSHQLFTEAQPDFPRSIKGGIVSGYAPYSLPLPAGSDWPTVSGNQSASTSRGWPAVVTWRLTAYP